MLIKRIFDIIFSFIGLLLLFPLIIIIFMIIKVSNLGLSPFFLQERVGKGGKIFNIYKFRTMNPSNNTSTITTKNDYRITKIGRFLRKTKIDELPQLWNVLIGDMSFVGPRPDVKGYADKLNKEDSLILSIRPGITSPASIKYKNEDQILQKQPNPIQYNNQVIYPDKVKLNLKYVKNRTLLLDLKIIFQTIFRK